MRNFSQSLDRLLGTLKDTGVTDNKITLITGGPGSGKSQIIKELCTYTHSFENHTCVIGFDDDWSIVANKVGGIIYEVPGDFPISALLELDNVLKNSPFVVLDLHQLSGPRMSTSVAYSILNTVFEQFVMAEGKGHLYIDEIEPFLGSSHDIRLEDILRYILCADECEKGLVVTAQVNHNPYQQFQSFEDVMPAFRPILNEIDIWVMLGLTPKTLQAVHQDISKMYKKGPYFNGKRLSIPRPLEKLSSLVTTVGDEINVSDYRKFRFGKG